MHSLSQLLCNISDPDQMQSILSAVLTEKEIESINNRMQIVQLLSEKKTQREVSAHLGVGIATVTRGASALKEGKFDVLFDLLNKSKAM